MQTGLICGMWGLWGIKSGDKYEMFTCVTERRGHHYLWMRLCNAPAGSMPKEWISFHGRERLLFVHHGCEATISEKSFVYVSVHEGLCSVLCLNISAHVKWSYSVCLYACASVCVHLHIDGKYDGEELCSCIHVFFMTWRQFQLDLTRLLGEFLIAINVFPA